MNNWITWIGLGLGASLVAGCAVDGVETSQVERPIVFGTPSDDPALDAIGGIVFKYAPVKFEDFTCTGTLVAPQVVVTARHCVLGESGWHFDPVPGFNNFMVFGDDVSKPAQKVKIKGYVTAPPSPNPTLLGDGGRDVAVLFLDQAPKGIIPAQLGRFEESMLGTQFRIAGFGSTEYGVVGQKVEGRTTARALAGDWYPLLFDNDYQAFEEWYWTDSSSLQLSQEQAESWWAPGTYPLETGFELLVGGSDGDALSCYGDSGGPLFRGETAQDFTLYGVSFAGEGSKSTSCGLGSGYTVLNDEMLAFVEGAIAAAPDFLGH